MSDTPVSPQCCKGRRNQQEVCVWLEHLCLRVPGDDDDDNVDGDHDGDDGDHDDDDANGKPVATFEDSLLL